MRLRGELTLRWAGEDAEGENGVVGLIGGQPRKVANFQ